jgi:hypothetical protein
MTERRWFLPDSPDIVGMLRTQVATTVRGMEAFEAWSRGEKARGDELRALEHEADDHKRALREALRSAFMTSLEPEDLFWLSKGVDDVINAAKDAVRESEVMAIEPDAAVAEMATLLLEGARRLSAAFDRLGGDGQAATTQADAAVKAQRRLERTYRRAMSALLEEHDLQLLIGRQELYRRLARISDSEVDVAERIWYSVVRET